MSTNPLFTKDFNPPKKVSPLIRSARWGMLLCGIIYGQVRYQWLLYHWPKNIIRDNITYYYAFLDKIEAQRKIHAAEDTVKLIALLNNEDVDI